MHASNVKKGLIENGLDRFFLTQIKQRFLDLSRERLQRIRSSQTERQHIFLDVLPLLFHTNHPMLPGYVGHQTPRGVSGYTPSKNDILLGQSLSRSFKYNHPEKHHQIYGLFAMGSAGTVGYSDKSDFDIWLCYNPSLDAKEIELLRSKCRKLTEWASSLGLEAHFFPMNHQQFKQGKQQALNSEASGSAQHYLLLDEFYRTALWLAGRYPLWWFVPCAEESDYENYTNILLNKRFIEPTEVLDFGSVHTIPDGEFIGAGVWQLYKAIESPYKSALKLILLECYAAEYPHIVPMSLCFKQHIYDGHLDANELDPYISVFRRIESYLLEREEFQRLDLIRRCLYFKINKSLSKLPTEGNKSWQRTVLEGLVKQWQWPKNEVAVLDARSTWKAQRVMTELKLLAKELNYSYQFLASLTEQIHTTHHINPEELKILGSKLQAAFQQSKGKIDWINPNISPDLAEPYLCLVPQASATETVETTSWAVYAQPANESKALFKQGLNPNSPLKRAHTLVELVTWCYCNGITQYQTHWEFLQPNLLLNRTLLRKFLQALKTWLPLPMPKVPHENFLQTPQTLSILVIINLEKDPHRLLHERGLHKLSEQDDALMFGSIKENIIHTIDIIELNTWHEVKTSRFSHGAAVELILYYLRTMATNPTRILPKVSFHCFNEHLTRLVVQRMEQLLADIVNCYHGGAFPSNTRYLLQLGKGFTCFEQENNQATAQHIDNLESLMDYLRQPLTQHRPLYVDHRALHQHPLRIISRYSLQAGIKVFFYTDKGSAVIYILDEYGSLFYKRQRYKSLSVLLQALHLFIRSAVVQLKFDHQSRNNRFGVYPVDFFELSRAHDDEFEVKRRHVSNDVPHVPLLDMRALPKNIHKPATEKQAQYALIYKQREFSEREHGKHWCTTAAKHILADQISNRDHGCYISNLDFSQWDPFVKNNTENNSAGNNKSYPPLGDLLTAKTNFEERLAKALGTR